MCVWAKIIQSVLVNVYSNGINMRRHQQKKTRKSLACEILRCGRRFLHFVAAGTMTLIARRLAWMAWVLPPLPPTTHDYPSRWTMWRRRQNRRYSNMVAVHPFNPLNKQYEWPIHSDCQMWAQHTYFLHLPKTLDIGTTQKNTILACTMYIYILCVHATTPRIHRSSITHNARIRHAKILIIW